MTYARNQSGLLPLAQELDRLRVAGVSDIDIEEMIALQGQQRGAGVPVTPLAVMAGIDACTPLERNVFSKLAASGARKRGKVSSEISRFCSLRDTNAARFHVRISRDGQFGVGALKPTAPKKATMCGRSHVAKPTSSSMSRPTWLASAMIFAQWHDRGRLMPRKRCSLPLRLASKRFSESWLIRCGDTKGMPFQAMRRSQNGAGFGFARSRTRSRRSALSGSSTGSGATITPSIPSWVRDRSKCRTATVARSPNGSPASSALPSRCPTTNASGEMSGSSATRLC
jgi:hypothetical protein